MSKNMAFFMKGKAKEVPEEEVIITQRYKDDEGKPIPFIMKALSTQRMDELEADCTKPEFKKGKRVGEKLDNKRFSLRIAVESTVYPDFRNAELLASYGLTDPVDLAKSILSVGGEYAEWMQAANRINGFDDSEDDLIDDVKN
ncbi:phage portal protein [Paenibacillus sp. 11B]|uniref:phage tail assembly chaperone n=1 Tax=unclassified Paenibacillus TaxID=185978 RepID=UPI0026524185|nr:phage portal protein [Paenibacillus sp. 11B]MDN8592022.1 phage portal protein [Paenibacillus sp. 11B]